MVVDLKSAENLALIEIGDTVTILPGYFYPNSGKVVVEEIYLNPYYEEVWMVRFMYHNKMMSTPLAGCVFVKSGKDINHCLWK